MADNIEKTHESLINDSLVKNAARIFSTKQVIEQYENQIKLFQELPTTLKKSVLVPIGTKGFLRGHIVHTNEVFHQVGCGYVIKRTAKQAIDYCDRMLVETNNFLSKLHQEENWLTDQLNITTKESLFAGKDCVEIVENYDEANEVEWRKKHRENVKNWKQNEAKEREIIQKEQSDQDIFSRLDELEILEELEQFTSNMIHSDFDKNITESQRESIKSIENYHEKIEDHCESMKGRENHQDKIEGQCENMKCTEIYQEKVEDQCESMKNREIYQGKIEDQCESVKSKEIYNENIENKSGSTKIIDITPLKIETQLENSKKEKVTTKVPNIEKFKCMENDENVKALDKCISSENLDSENIKKYLDFLELHKLNENLEKVHKIANNENKINVDINTRKLEIEDELEKSRKSKTIIKTDEDLIKRLDELEKEENLLEEMEILTSTTEIINSASIPSVNEDDDSKKCTIRFNEQVRTNFYVSSKAVVDEVEAESIKNCEGDTKIGCNAETVAEDDPVTLYIYFSHTQDDLVDKSTEGNVENVSELGMLKPSDIYDLPYRPKSILKNKNRLFEEPQHTGEPLPEPITYSHRKKDRGRDRWVCYDTFSSKNGNDSDQENANVVQVPPPLTEVKEKTDFNNSAVASTTVVTTPPKKRQSRFLVSRALITKK